MRMIPVYLAVEDEVSEAVLKRLLKQPDRGYAIGTVFGRSGYGYLRHTIPGWNRPARGVPFIILTDLDRYPCPSALIQDWIPRHQHPNLLLRVAVREVESWILADRENLARFLRVNPTVVPAEPDSLSDAKAALVRTADRSRSREIRRRLVPKRGSTAKQGPDYNACLIEFVASGWAPSVARRTSPSLSRTMDRLQSFVPQWDRRPEDD